MAKNQRTLGLLVNDFSILEYHTEQLPSMSASLMPTEEMFAKGPQLLREATGVSEGPLTVETLEPVVRTAIDLQTAIALPGNPKIPYSVALVGTLLFQSQTQGMDIDFLPTKKEFDALVNYRNECALLAALLNKRVVDKQEFANYLTNFAMVPVRDLGTPHFKAVYKTLKEFIDAFNNGSENSSMLVKATEHLFRWANHSAITRFVPYASQQQFTNWIQIRTEGIAQESLPAGYESLFKGMISAFYMTEILRAYRRVLFHANMEIGEKKHPVVEQTVN